MVVATVLGCVLRPPVIPMSHVHGQNSILLRGRSQLEGLTWLNGIGLRPDGCYGLGLVPGHVNARWPLERQKGWAKRLDLRSEGARFDPPVVAPV